MIYNLKDLRWTVGDNYVFSTEIDHAYHKYSLKVLQRDVYSWWAGIIMDEKVIVKEISDIKTETEAKKKIVAEFNKIANVNTEM